MAGQATCRLLALLLISKFSFASSPAKNVSLLYCLEEAVTDSCSTLDRLTFHHLKHFQNSHLASVIDLRNVMEMATALLVGWNRSVRNMQ